MGSTLRAVTSALERHLLYQLAEKTGRVVDLAYSGLVHQLGLTPRFFPEVRWWCLGRLPRQACPPAALLLPSCCPPAALGASAAGRRRLG